jgi:Protein of unknown function (DUF2892)
LPSDNHILPPARFSNLLGGTLVTRNFHRPDTHESLVMKMEMIVRRFAGTFILASLLLANYHSPYWLWFTAFVGFNLLQSSFTGFCPLTIILGRLGFGGACGAVAGQPGCAACEK